MVFCRNCGKQIEDNIEMCPNCGVEVKDEVPEEDIAIALKRKKTIRKRVLWSSISFLLVFILSITGVVIYFSRENAKAEFEDYYCEDYNVYRINITRLINNLEGIYEYYNSTEIQMHWNSKDIEGKREKIVKSICSYRPENDEIRSVHKYLIEASEYLDEIVDMKRKELFRGISISEENELDKNIELFNESLEKYYKACEKYIKKYDLKVLPKINTEMR